MKILWKSNGNPWKLLWKPKEIAMKPHGNPIDTPWTSCGDPKGILCKPMESYGNHYETLREPYGRYSNPMEIPWTSYGNLIEIP